MIMMNCRLLFAQLVAALLLLSSGCSFFDHEEDWQQRDIIFSGRPSGFDAAHGIYAINLDGTGLVPILTSEHDAFTSPAPSPDGSKLVYQSSLGATTLGSRHYVVHFDGSPLIPGQAVIWSEKNFVGNRARWQDNDTFAFVWCPTCEVGGTVTHGYEAWIVNKSVRELDLGDVVLVLPGPDSTYAVQRERDTPTYTGLDVVLRRNTVAGWHELIVAESVSYGLAWSPAGDELAFIEGGAELVVVDTLGIEQVRHTLLDAGARDSLLITGQLEWLPDNTTVLANRTRLGPRVMNRETMIAVDLTTGSVRDVLSGDVRFEMAWNPHARIDPVP